MTPAPADRARLLAAMERHGIGSLDYRGPDATLSLSRMAPEESLAAPFVGRFRAAYPGQAPLPLPRLVAAGDVVAYLKIGALLRPVHAPQAMRLDACLVAENAVIGYGTPLFSCRATPERA